jgi:Uma2 family endonuclease
MAINLKLRVIPTDDDILDLSRENPGYQFERAASGALVVTPTGSDAGRRTAEVISQLWAWNRMSGTGVVFDSSTGFRMPDGSLLSPDASWIRRARWEALTPRQRAGFAPLCSDVVFEVRSESDRVSDLQAKAHAHAYLANGAGLAVLIDPEARTVSIYRPRRDTTVLENSAHVSLDPELAGFVLEVAAILT